jgi:hypothetical protein
MKRRPQLKRRPTRAEIGDLPLRQRANGSYDAPPRRGDYEGDGSYGDRQINLRLKKGTKHIGRLKGVPNKFTRVMREASIIAAEQAARELGAGSTLVDYLRFIATRYPAVYARSILARLIPYAVNLNANMALQSSAEIRAELIAKGIPVPEYLFKRPQVPAPGPRIERRPVPSDPEPPPEPDEDALPREPVVRTNEPPRITANPYSPFARSRPPLDTRPVGPVLLGTQYELPWGSYSNNFDLCCWHEGRPPRLVHSRSDENGEDSDGRSDNETPPPAAERSIR